MCERSGAKVVPGFTRYECSPEGRVWNVRTGRELSPRLNHQGYYTVNLTNDDGVRKWMFVHRLVYLAFVGHVPPGIKGGIICHRNDDKTDNRVDNLYLGTHAQNKADERRNGLNYWSNVTHCAQGHEFNEANIYWANNGRRRKCRLCTRRIQRKGKVDP